METRIDRVKGALAAAHQRWQREVPLLSDKWLIVPAALILALVCFLVVTLKWIWVDHIFDSVELPTYGHGAVEMAAKGDETTGMEGPSATVSSDGDGSSGDSSGEEDGRNQGGGVGTNIIPDVILPSVPPLLEPTPPETTTPTGTVSSTIFQLTTIPTQKTFTGHGIPCRDQDAGYCLNGGTCTQLPAPGAGNKFEKRCTCTDDYFGNRCQYAASIRELQARLRRKRSFAFRGAEEIHQKRVLAITGICLALLVVGIMCGVAWYMSRKQRKKWCRKHLMANGEARGGDAEEPHEGEIMIPMTNLAGASRTEPKQDLADETSFRNGDSRAPHDNPNGDVGRNQPMDDLQGGRRKRLNGVAKQALSKPSWQSTPNKDRSPRKEFAALPDEPSPIPEPSTPPRPLREHRPLPVPDIQQFRQASRESSQEDLANESTPLRKGSSASSSGSSLQLDTSRPVRKPFITREPDDVDLSTKEFRPYDVTDGGDLTPEFTPTNTPRIQRDRRDFPNNNPPYISTSRPSDEEDENDNFNATDPDFHARLRNVIENQEAVAV
ncbi:uncharacterized protein LOC118412562 isoform X12 [Branchiostoma floridae]|uniref:Uncharacterized protein LOC118412562 isoform X12 n=1 Tax=Branchiostoma floridae TaxID=7739 RepID=A0A9J7KW99_BRAFL|nr:uncharacterized protein LOC118412562 isoform X12 [Branchiostoma floridae]